MRYSIHMWQQHPSPPNPFPSPNLGGGGKFWGMRKNFCPRKKMIIKARFQIFKQDFNKARFKYGSTPQPKLLEIYGERRRSQYLEVKNFILHQNRVKILILSYAYKKINWDSVCLFQYDQGRFLCAADLGLIVQNVWDIFSVILRVKTKSSRGQRIKIAYLWICDRKWKGI